MALRIAVVLTGRKKRRAGKEGETLLKNFVSVSKSWRNSCGHAGCMRYLKSIQNVIRKT